MNLQKAGLGILGAFGLKVTGQNPPLFGDAVLPVADVFDQYLATSELQLKLDQSNVNLATFNGSSFTVPNGKVWRVIGAGWGGAVNAADVALKSIIDIGITSPNSAPASVVIASGAPDPGGAVTRAFGANFRPPIFLPSGWTISLAFFTSAALTVTFARSAGVFYQEFDL